MLTVSIVLFKTDYDQLVRCIDSVNKSIDATIFLIDNSPANKLEKVAGLYNNVKYIFNPTNPGYGAAHNVALRSALQTGGRYHLVLNADVYFDASTLGSLIDYMNRMTDVGLVMPKVLFPNGEIQYLCKLVPTPLDLIGRMVLPKIILNLKCGQQITIKKCLCHIYRVVLCYCELMH